MNVTGLISRRQLVRGLLGLTGALVACPFTLAGAPAKGGDVPADGQRLLQLLPHRHSARIVGREYIRSAAGEATPACLVRLLCQDAAQRRRLIDAGGSELQAWFRARQRQEFAAGEIVLLRGWVLARSEARLCALAALL